LKRGVKGKVIKIGLIIAGLFIVIAISSNTSWGSNLFGAPVRTVVTPFQSFFSWVGGGIVSFGNYFGDTAKLKAENETNKAKIIEQAEQIRKLQEFEVENKDLQKALNLIKEYDKYDKVGGNIIAKEPGNWFSTFTIDVGSDKGVKVDSPVVDGNGLVGRIVTVNAGSAVVESVIDPYSKVSGYNSRTQKLVISLRGDINLARVGKCRLEYVDENIEVGDLIVTSGISGIFPRGLPIGKITEIHQSNTQLDSYAVVQPTVEFGKLHNVFVLVNKK